MSYLPFINCHALWRFWTRFFIFLYYFIVLFDLSLFLLYKNTIEIGHKFNNLDRPIQILFCVHEDIRKTKIDWTPIRMLCTFTEFFFTLSQKICIVWYIIFTPLCMTMQPTIYKVFAKNRARPSPIFLILIRSSYRYELRVF